MSDRFRGGRRSMRPRPFRPLQSLRLRHKLGASLVIAALLPVAVASWVAVSVVLRSLERGVRQDTQRQLHVGLNLVLRNVEGVGKVAARLARLGDLADAIRQGPVAIADQLAAEEPYLPSALVQVTNERGVIQAQRVIGGVVPRFRGLEVTQDSPLIRAGLEFDRRLTIVPVEGRLVIRASAPIVDDRYQILGAVIVSVPMDGAFADGVKAALGTEVLLIGPDGLANSTFLDPVGARVADIRASDSVRDRVHLGDTVIENRSIGAGSFAVGYAPIMSIDGHVVGIFAVAVDRGPVILARSAATRSLALGAAGAFVFALGLAGLLSRRITRPLQHLHEGAISIARGDLDHRIAVSEGDELGDLAKAFDHMTRALKENQRRLAARMREIVALHDAGRAVSSVIELDQVLRKIVDSVARVLHVRVCALWLVENPDRRKGDAIELSLGAGRGRRADMRTVIGHDEIAGMVEPLAAIAEHVAAERINLQLSDIDEDQIHGPAAVASGIDGSMVATALERKGNVVGVIIIGRGRSARSFSEADANLLATFADQAATAIENARLYAEVRASSEELEAKVKLRTAELEAINAELGRTITELRETQSQLILSERLAGLGQLVASVAHEINSPSAAIRGTADALPDNVRRLSELIRRLSGAGLPAEACEKLGSHIASLAEKLATHQRPSPVTVRREKKAIEALLRQRGLGAEMADLLAQPLAEFGARGELATTLADNLKPLASLPGLGSLVARLLVEQTYLVRGTQTIQDSIRRIQRIVGSLKTYSHLDQDDHRREVDIHEGIDNTLVIFDHLLSRGIIVSRRYGDLPKIPVFVDELNQVWTNLIHNAVQALEGEGNIAIESEANGEAVIVRVIDDGPGIPADVVPRIFEPFFTTKPKGEGTGLGLGIVRQIVERHGGSVRCDSRPGRTCFEVTLPSNVASDSEESARDA